MRNLEDLGIRIQGLCVLKPGTLETFTSKCTNSHEYRQFFQTDWFCNASLSKLSYIDQYCSIVADTVIIYSIVLSKSTQYNQPLPMCSFFSLLTRPVENELYEVTFMLKINTTYSCTLSWLEKLKSKEVYLTFGVREEGVCVGHHFLWDLIPSSLRPKKGVLHWSPEAQRIGKNLSGHLIDSPAIAGSHSIEIVFITWSTFTTERTHFFL